MIWKIITSSKSLVIGLFIALVLTLGVFTVQTHNLNREKAKKQLYQDNYRLLLEVTKSYQTKDSLNVVSIGTLKMTIDEYERYRSDDKKVIEQLKIDKRRLEDITTIQSKTIASLKGTVNDSIVYRDNFIIDTLRCITVNDEWFSIHGCSDSKNKFSGTMTSYDNLLVVGHVKQKRFLGFLWYRGKKDTFVEVVSKNPSTVINSVEYVELRRK